MALYLVWLPLTCMGKIKAADVPENEAFGRPSEAQPPVTEEDMERDSEMEGSKSVSFSVNSNSATNANGSANKTGIGKSNDNGPQKDVNVQGDALHTIPV